MILLMRELTALKIEGRMKTALYVATVARTYRKAIDDYLKDPETIYGKHMAWYQAADRRAAPTDSLPPDFSMESRMRTTQIYDNNTYGKGYTYLGYAEEKREGGLYRITQRNKFLLGETIEVMKPDGRNLKVSVKGIFDEEEGQAMESAPHPQQTLYVDLGTEVEVYDILRRREEAS